MGQVERTVPRIYAALEDCQAYHQSTMVEVEGNIAKKYVSIFIDSDLFIVISLLKLLRFVILIN